MSHIDGRRQRRLSKNKDYKKRYGCPAGPGMYHPHPSQAQAKRIDRRRLKRQLQPLREFGWCNGCDGIGTQEHFAHHYRFEVENVKEFGEFLVASGGFEIC